MLCLAISPIRKEDLLIIAILIQSFAIIFVYEGLQQQGGKGFSGASSSSINTNTTTAVLVEGGSSSPNAMVNDDTTNADDKHIRRGIHHNTAINPGGLILSSSFSYMQDPREVHRKNPLPHILPTYENIYHFDTTVRHHKLHAIIFHDKYSFNESFVKKHTSEYLQFILIDDDELPTHEFAYDITSKLTPKDKKKRYEDYNGDPLISPNDFRYVVFNKFLKEHSKIDEQKGQTLVNGIHYDWIMISDMDMIFQRNLFPLLNDYSKRYNLTFFGSYDGGTWADENLRMQRRLFRNCYGRKLILSWKDDVELATPNGNCGLWAGRHKEVSCILQCTSDQYDTPPVRGKGKSTICDMVTHDWCVHYGGCFPNSTKGIYDTQKKGVLWGEASMGVNNDLFGPPYNRHKACDWNSWAVVHNRCDRNGPICFDKDEKGDLVKYHQQTRGRRCKLDSITDLPLVDSQLCHAEYNISSC